jgi:transposase-like protein
MKENTLYLLIENGKTVYPPIEEKDMQSREKYIPVSVLRFKCRVCEKHNPYNDMAKAGKRAPYRCKKCEKRRSVEDRLLKMNEEQRRETFLKQLDILESYSLHFEDAIQDHLFSIRKIIEK